MFDCQEVNFQFKRLQVSQVYENGTLPQSFRRKQPILIKEIIIYYYIINKNISYRC